jgi:hypothetical protein
MEWVEQTYEALDTKDVDAFRRAAHARCDCAPSATAIPSSGRVAIREAYSQFLDAHRDGESRVHIAAACRRYAHHRGDRPPSRAATAPRSSFPAATVCELTEGKARPDADVHGRVASLSSR